MKTLKIILSWVFLYPLSLFIIGIGNIYLWIKKDMNDFNEIVIKQIK